MRLRVWWMLIVCGLAAFAPARPDRVVLGYSAGWFDRVAAPEDYHFDGLTHLARSFLLPKADGAVEVPPGYFDPTLEKLAHAKSVKLLMSVGGAADSAEHWVKMASDPAALGRFVDTLGRLMRENRYDGVDIDWEPAPLTDAEGVAYVRLLKALRAKYPAAVITTALPAGEYWVSHMSWPDVIASVDYVNVMTYDYAGTWGGVAGHGSNLFPPAAYPPQPEYSVAQGMENLLKNRKLPPEKLLMGLIFSAYRFRTANLGDKFPVNARGQADNLTYGRVQDLMAGGHYLSLWDTGARQPYLKRDGGAGVVSYESPESIRRKCEYAKELGVAGVMIWHVGSDVSGRQAPLMDTVAGNFGVGPMTLPAEALRRQAADVAEAVRGGRRREGGADAPSTRPASEADVAALEATLAKLRAEWAAAEDRRWEAGPATRRAQ